MISFVYFCSTSCLRCHQVSCISFSILHSISWEEGTTILSVPSIDRLLGCSLFIAIMTTAAINILIRVFWCTCTDSSTGNMSRSGFLSWKRDIRSGFQITSKYFPKGFTLTVCEHSNESGASLCRDNFCQPCMLYQNRHAVMDIVLELETWVWDMGAPVDG